MAYGVRVHCEPQGRGPRKVMYFRDPDGIILEAIEEVVPPRYLETNKKVFEMGKKYK